MNTRYVYTLLFVENNGKWRVLECVTVSGTMLFNWFHFLNDMHILKTCIEVFVCLRTSVTNILLKKISIYKGAGKGTKCCVTKKLKKPMSFLLN